MSTIGVFEQDTTKPRMSLGSAMVLSLIWGKRPGSKGKLSEGKMAREGILIWWAIHINIPIGIVGEAAVTCAVQ